MNARSGRWDVHPSKVLRDELDALGLSTIALSPGLGVPVTRELMIMNGYRGVSGDTTLRWRGLLGQGCD